MDSPPAMTARVSECFDPEIYPPPKGATLWVVNSGGSGHKGIWYEGAIAWAYLPKLPATVKARLDAQLLEKQQQEEERDHESDTQFPEEEQQR